jgi:hypothetical protein
MKAPYILTAGQRTPWLDFRGVRAFEMQGKNDSGSIATLYAANVDPTSETATVADELPAESFSGSTFAKSLYSPMPLYGYVKNTGAGTLTLTFGQSENARGDIATVNEVGFGTGTSGRSNEMPS